MNRSVTQVHWFINFILDIVRWQGRERKREEEKEERSPFKLEPNQSVFNSVILLFTSKITSLSLYPISFSREIEIPILGHKSLTRYCKQIKTTKESFTRILEFWLSLSQPYSKNWRQFVTWLSCCCCCCWFSWCMIYTWLQTEWWSPIERKDRHPDDFNMNLLYFAWNGGL